MPSWSASVRQQNSPYTSSPKAAAREVRSPSRPAAVARLAMPPGEEPMPRRPHLHARCRQLAEAGEDDVEEHRAVQEHVEGRLVTGPYALRHAPAFSRPDPRHLLYAQPVAPSTSPHRRASRRLPHRRVGAAAPSSGGCRTVEWGLPHRRVGAAAPSSGGCRTVEWGLPHRRVGAAAPSSRGSRTVE